MYRDSSNADGTAILTSPALESYKKQIADLQAQLSIWQAKVAEYQKNWDTRYQCGGLKKPCNDWLDKRNEATNNVNAINQNIANIQTKIAEELKTLQTQAQIQAQTDPTLSKIQADSAIAEAQAKNKKLIYILVGIAVLLVAIGIGYYFYKRKRG